MADLSDKAAAGEAMNRPWKPGHNCLNDILTAVAEYYRISLRDLLGRSKLIELARPRQVAMYLAALHTRKSHSQIAREFGKDHTTVIHALRRIEEFIKHDDELAEDIMFLTQQLSHRSAA